MSGIHKNIFLFDKRNTVYTTDKEGYAASMRFDLSAVYVDHMMFCG